MFVIVYYILIYENWISDVWIFFSVWFFVLGIKIYMNIIVIKEILENVKYVFESLINEKKIILNLYDIFNIVCVDIVEYILYMFFYDCYR